MFGKTLPLHDQSKRVVQKQFSDVEVQDVLDKNMFLPRRPGKSYSSDGPASFQDLSELMGRKSTGFRKSTIAVPANREAADGLRSDIEDSNADKTPKHRGKGKGGSSLLRKAFELPTSIASEFESMDSGRSPKRTFSRGVKLDNDDAGGSSTPRSRDLFSPRSKSRSSSILNDAKTLSLLSEPGDM